MDAKLFGPEATGRLIPTIHGARAFLPDPLPPKIDKEGLFDIYGEAMAALGMLNAKIAQLTNPSLIIRPLQKREALASSAMEGTYTTTDELALLDAGVEAVRPETVEVQNCAKALFATTRALDTLPISHRMVRDTHAILLQGLPSAHGGNKRPGEYKTDQNWIGGSTIQTARFVPPPPKESLAAMDALELFINREHPEDIPPLIEAGIVHYQFEAIHPFADGNGRVGRILIPVLLVARHAISTAVFYPSAVLEHRKDEYIDRMFAVSAKGDWTNWLHFFLSACVETCSVSISLIDRITELHAKYKQQVISLSRSNNPLILVDELFSSPVISTPMARDKLSVTHRAARLTIGTLEEAGIVEKLPGFAMPEYFVAREILKIAS